MPVIKCKTYQEATENLWCFEPNTAYYKRLAGFWRSINKLCPIKHPKGIFKYKSTEEAARRIDEWLLNIDYLRIKAIKNKVSGLKGAKS